MKKLKYILYILIGQALGLGFAVGFANGMFTVIY